ncbi:glycosyltransferase family 2 protein [Halopseudomonas sp.]|uniref:glycosyltransferase family 2 protein n=1 Tax=Halopseudomonas sp. TaxID=2901191 RepID=UPI0030036611
MVKPLLRIVIPTYNRSERIKTLICRLELSSKHPLVQVVVVDDFSRPEEREYLRILADEFKSVRFEFLSRNSGGGGARNAGALIGDAEWVWFVDDDDILSSETVLGVVDVIATTCENDRLVFLCANFINEGSVNKVVPNGRDIFKAFSRYGNEINTSCAIFNFELFKQLGGWDENLVAGQDTDLLLRASELTDAVVLAQFSVDIIQDGTDRITTNPKKQMIGKAQFLKKHYKRLFYLRSLRYLVTLLAGYPYLRRLLNK